MNIKIGILNVPKHDNKHDLIHFVTDIRHTVWAHDAEDLFKFFVKVCEYLTELCPF